MILKGTFKVTTINKVFYCTKSKQYSGTVFLPKTKFPLRLENKKLLERDINIYNAAGFENLYNWQRSHLSEPEFVLHDGPPYANGQPHMGHAINKILKDTILRYNILQGNKVHYIPGWDCHGLPIELKALSNSYNVDPIQVRLKAKQFAQKTIEEQKVVFKSWGVVGDWKNAYTTYSKEYVKIQFRQFYKLYEKKLIYRDVKPVYWSPSSRTALAEAELEYNKDHKSPSAFIRFEVNDIPKVDFIKGKRVYAIIWTTTPWTLPSNHAISYNENLSYSFVKKSNSHDTDLYIVATELVSNLSSTIKCNFEEIHIIKGNLLDGATYIHPIYKKVHSFLNSSHATAYKGTGLVHTAGAHGPDDFLVALRNKLSIVDMVNEFGCYNTMAGPNLEGKYVLTDGNKAVLEMIKNDLMHLEEITHSYPYDWRTKKPVIIKASQQWFIDTNLIKNRAVELLENVNFIPSERSKVYKKNLCDQIQKRPYWCISRQRQWGVPIPVFYDKDCSSVIFNEEIINHHCNLLESYGTDFWWNLSTKELLPEHLHSYKLDSLEKGQDIMDIWLDSGISWAKVLEGSKIADMYLEGVDQFMGWFQSSLLTSVALRDKAPYKTIYVHGFAVDENGNKMSKSIGNVVDPVEITSGKKGQKPYGIDTLRWWVTCHANHVPLANVSTTVLQSSAEEVQKIRSVLRFALGCLSDYEVSEEDSKNLPLIDKYMLHLLYQFHMQVNEFMNDYQFHKISFALINLLTNQVSALYYTVIKDRLYCDHLGSPTRRAAQYTLLNLFEIITYIIAPMIPHLAEELYYYLPQKSNKSYFTSTHLKPNQKWVDPDLEYLMSVILNSKKDINKELSTNTMDANIEITVSQVIIKLFEAFGTINDIEHQLEDIFQVSKVRLVAETSIANYKVTISESKKHICLRCRRRQSEKEDQLCIRCFNVVQSLNDNKTAISN